MGLVGKLTVRPEKLTLAEPVVAPDPLTPLVAVVAPEVVEVGLLVELLPTPAPVFEVTPFDLGPPATVRPKVDIPNL